MPKLLILTAIIMALAFPAVADEDTGRFQIASGQMIASGAGTGQVAVTLMLDTQTGQNWMLVQPTDGTVRWLKVPFDTVKVTAPLLPQIARQ